MSVTSSIAASTPKNTKISELQATQTRAFVTLSKQIFADKPTVSVAQATAISTKYPAVTPGRIPATSSPTSASHNFLGRANPNSIAGQTHHVNKIEKSWTY